MTLKRLISIILTVSIISTSFPLLFQVSAQNEATYIEATQFSISEDGNVQTDAIPAQPVYEYIINNKDNFIEFMTKPLLWKSNYKVTLACDIDMKGKVFKPIKEFSGVFDGCGHTVSNILIKNSAGLYRTFELAFIKTLNKFAEIKNVNFENYSIEDTSWFCHNSEKISVFVLNNHGTVAGVNINNVSMNDVYESGKAAGFVLNNKENGVIENCSVENICLKRSNINAGFVGMNAGKITNSSTTLPVNSEDLAGGFVRENVGTIEWCISIGDVNSAKCAGGFCGNNLGEIVSCKSECNVKAKTKSRKIGTICGGFVGENNGIIKDSSSTKSVVGQECVGGFCGKNDVKGEINSCKSTCDVKSKTNIASIYCGVFVGSNKGEIKNCDCDGKVDGNVNAEKIIAIGVGVTITAILMILGICFLLKKFKVDKTKNAMLRGKKDGCFMGPKDSILSMMPINTVNEYNGGIYGLIEEDFKNNAKKLISANDQELLAAANKFIENNIKTLEAQKKVSNVTDEIYNISKDVIKEGYISFVRCIKNIKNIDINNITQDVISSAENSMMNTIWNEATKAQTNFENEYEYLKNALSTGFIVSLTVALIGGTSSVGETIKKLRRGYAHVGIFGGNNFGTMVGCTANGSQVTVKTLYNKYSMCGGFIGTNVGTIKDCSVTGSEISNKTYTGGYLGGFVGENIGKIENSTTKVSVASGKCTGGFCGNNIGEISGSRSEGNVTANAKIVKTTCGGFVGVNSGKVKDSFSIGSVTGQEYVGGFCGDNLGEISNSKSEGNAKASTKVNTNRCGGFVGENAGIVKDSTSTGSTTGEEYVGGFAGVNKLEISGCDARGKATAKTKAHTALAGGFVGENEKGSITDCAATGGADSRSTSGQAKAGGFVGINKANIVSSKASGEVYLSAGTCHKDDGCGGFVGRNDQGGNIYGCYVEAIVETTKRNKGGGFVGEAKDNSGIYNSTCKTKRIISKKRKTEKADFWKNKDDNAVIKNYNLN